MTEPAVAVKSWFAGLDGFAELSGTRALRHHARVGFANSSAAPGAPRLVRFRALAVGRGRGACSGRSCIARAESVRSAVVASAAAPSKELEILLLRHELAVLRRQGGRPEADPRVRPDARCSSASPRRTRVMLPIERSSEAASSTSASRSGSGMSTDRPTVAGFCLLCSVVFIRGAPFEIG